MLIRDSVSPQKDGVEALLQSHSQQGAKQNPNSLHPKILRNSNHERNVSIVLKTLIIAFGNLNHEKKPRKPKFPKLYLALHMP